MRSGRTIAFIMLALLSGGVLTQLPPALGDNSENPFSAIWDAIFDLQNRDDDLQAQIDELRAERDGLRLESAEPGFASDPYAVIESEETEDGRMLVHITAGNNGPDRAAGVKLTAFYLMPLYKINSINDDRCEDKSRGIIECILGTLEASQESVITIDAYARQSGEENTWTADISTTTGDKDYTNNHMTFDIRTGAVEPVEITEEQEDSVQDDANEVPEAESEQDNESSANSTSVDTEEPQSSGNQTSDETGEETVNDSNSTSTEESEDGQSSEETQQGTSEGSGESSSETSDGQTEEEQSDESGTGGSSEDSNEHSSEESPSEQSGPEDSESSKNEENLSQ